MSTKKKLGRNDPCHCGSNEKYKNCHMAVDQEAGIRVVTDIVKKIKSKDDLKNKTLAFIDLIKYTFGIVYDPSSHAGAILGDVDNEKIKLLYKELPHYFPHDSDFPTLHNDIAETPISGFLWASPSINTIANYLARYALYTPHLIVVNPFCDMMRYHKTASPLVDPAPWRQVAVNQSLFLVSLEPWIREDFVSVLPPIRWFDHNFFNGQLKPLAESRIQKGYKDEFMKDSMPDFMLDLLGQFPPKDIEKILEALIPDIPKQIVKTIKAYSEMEYEKNPVRYEWTDLKSSASMLKSGSGNNLESAVLTANQCGSYILIGEDVFKKQFDLAVKGGDESFTEQLSLLSRAFRELDFNFLNSVNLDFVLNIRRDGRMADLRNYLIKVFDSVSSLDLTSQQTYHVFKDELEHQYRLFKEEWKDIDHKLAKDFAKATIGGGIAVLSGKIGFQVAAGGLAYFGLEGLFRASDNRRDQKRKPLAIFHELERSYRR